LADLNQYVVYVNAVILADVNQYVVYVNAVILADLNQYVGVSLLLRHHRSMLIIYLVTLNLYCIGEKGEH